MSPTVNLTQIISSNDYAYVDAIWVIQKNKKSDFFQKGQNFDFFK